MYSYVKSWGFDVKPFLFVLLSPASKASITECCCNNNFIRNHYFHLSIVTLTIWEVHELHFFVKFVKCLKITYSLHHISITPWNNLKHISKCCLTKFMRYCYFSSDNEVSKNYIVQHDFLNKTQIHCFVAIETQNQFLLHRILVQSFNQ